MKLTVILLAVLAVAASAINWEYPDALAGETRTALETFLNAYECACMDSLEYGGEVFVMPTAIHNFYVAEAQIARTAFIAKWTELNNYIMEN